MIKAVTVRNLKRFQEQRFDLSEHVVLAGPNNSGKTTLLQAIVLWDLALWKWREKRGPQSGSTARERSGVPLTRAELTALPLREMNLLWWNRLTALGKVELTGTQKLGHPRVLSISMEGEEGGEPWELTMEFRYQSTEMAYVKPAKDTLPEVIEKMQIVHVPPFSGIGVEEPEYKKEYQDRLIGQGKPGEVLRNLLVEVHDRGIEAWESLCRDIQDIFHCQLLPPQHHGLPIIVCEYVQETPKKGSRGGRPPTLDIASAGSGFHQVLLLLAFVYARPATIFLLDEPDAHLHVVLQKQIYDKLRSTFARQRSQLVIATHSEVLIDDTDPQAVLSFYGDPHRLMQSTEVEQVREALNRLSAMDLLLAEDSKGILYLESQDDFNLLQAWAKVLGHPLYERWFIRSPFWHPNNGSSPREARAHFFAMRAIHDDFKGYLLLDGDNRNLKDREIDADGLTIARWSRYEAESYLVHPAALRRFLRTRVAGELFLTQAVEYLENDLPPAVLRNPVADHDYLVRTPASKTLLPGYFRAAQDPLAKKEYYLIAEQMTAEEIPQEIRTRLNDIAASLGIEGV